MEYEDNKHESEDISITVKKFKIDGSPVCSSWYSGNKEHPQEVCEFLRTFNFGTKFKCSFVDEKLEEYKNNLIKPDKNCPLWK